VVSEVQETELAGVEPKSMVVLPEVVRKPAPLTVTVVPPDWGPEDGEREVTTGT
jgi:hypothetical protein